MASLQQNINRGDTTNASIHLHNQGRNRYPRFAIMGLGVKHGDTVTVSVEGPGEEADAAALLSLLSENL